MLGVESRLALVLVAIACRTAANEKPFVLSRATAMPGEVSALAAAIGTIGIGLPLESVVPDSALISAAIDGLSAVLINGTESPLVSTPGEVDAPVQRVVERDFDDRGFDQHLRAPDVEVVDDLHDLAHLGRIGAHDDGVHAFRRPECSAWSANPTRQPLRRRRHRPAAATAAAGVRDRRRPAREGFRRRSSRRRATGR